MEKVYRTEKIETVALNNVNLEIAGGEFLSVMGPSGSGKSTLLNVLGLLDEPSAGKVMLDEATVNDFSDRKLAALRNREIGFIFQSFHLIADLERAGQRADPAALPGPLEPRAARSGPSRRWNGSASARACTTTRPSSPAASSSAWRSRGRSSATPRLLLADEPTGNLDSKMGEEVMQILEEYNREAGVTVVMVTHDQRLAERTERIVRLFDGRQVH